MADRQPERTEDGRYIVVDGRRAVGVATRAGDEGAERAARQRVQAAKVALGERGHPWWEPPTEGSRRERLEAAVLALAGKRAPEKTICPSDAARAVGGEGWRDDMDLARDVVRQLASAGAVEVLQGGEPQPAHADWTGPIRVRFSDGRARHA